MASEYECYRCRVNAAEGRRLWRAIMKAIAVGSRPQVVASENEGYRCRFNAAEGRR